MGNRITEEMLEVLRHLSYDKETGTIIADCHLAATGAISAHITTTKKQGKDTNESV